MPGDRWVGTPHSKAPIGTSRRLVLGQSLDTKILPNALQSLSIVGDYAIHLVAVPTNTGAFSLAVWWKESQRGWIVVAVADAVLVSKWATTTDPNEFFVLLLLAMWWCWWYPCV